MKIGTPELKVKPATKYFDHGYISFSTVNKELYYKIMFYSDTRVPVALFDKPKPVKDLDYFKLLMSIKTRLQMLELET